MVEHRHTIPSLLIVLIEHHKVFDATYCPCRRGVGHGKPQHEDNDKTMCICGKMFVAERVLPEGANSTVSDISRPPAHDPTRCSRIAESQGAYLEVRLRPILKTKDEGSTTVNHELLGSNQICFSR